MTSRLSAVPGTLRVSELVAGLSVVSDLAKGLDEGQGIRACVLAMRLAEHLDLDARDRATLFWVGLLRFVGCTATAPELEPTGIHRVSARRGRRPSVIRAHEVASCEVAQAIASRLGLPDSVGQAMRHVFERWDGGGNPGWQAQIDIEPAVRVWQVAHIADLVAATSGVAAVAPALRKRRGSSLDPDIAEACARAAPSLLTNPAPAEVVDLLALEPQPHYTTDAAGIDEMLRCSASSPT
jgi:HD-GYP domain-containing protein (c-di-GMP phosphodiesterase class II)